MYALSSALAVVAIGMLTVKDLYGPQRDTLMAGLSVLSLVASLVVGQLNYAVRSRDLQNNYKEIQFVSQTAEYFKTHDPTRQNFERVLDQYRDLIRTGENQTTGDNYRGQNEGRKHLICYGEALVTSAPYLFLMAPILLLVPLIGSF